MALVGAGYILAFDVLLTLMLHFPRQRLDIVNNCHLTYRGRQLVHSHDIDIGVVWWQRLKP